MTKTALEYLWFERRLVWACKCAAMCGGFVEVAFFFVFNQAVKCRSERFISLAHNVPQLHAGGGFDR